MKKAIALLCMFLLAGNACAAVALRPDGGALLSDRNGSVIVPFGVYSDIVRLDEDCFAAQADGGYALMSGDGRLLTEEVYETLRCEEGFVLACQNGLWQMLDKNGAVLTDAVYESIVPNSSGAWALRADSDALYTLNKSGAEKQTQLRIRRIEEDSADGLIAVQLTDTLEYVYCDTEGELAFDGRFYSAGVFSEGKAVVSAEGKTGLIDAQGKFVVPAEYDFAALTANGAILAEDETGIYVFDNEGRPLAEYEGRELSAAVVGSHYVIAGREESCVYSDDGNLVCALSADAGVYEGLDGALILSEGAWGEECVYLAGTDSRYQNLFPLGYAEEKAVYGCMRVNVARYMNSLLNEIQISADMDSALYGLVGPGGEMLLEPGFEQIEYLEDDRFLVRSDDQWQMIDSSGRVYWRMDATVTAPN